MSYHYGQPTYPSTSYPPPHQPPYYASSSPLLTQYQPPPPPPMSAEEAFRFFYRGHLATLTVNSRPIINQLTQLAYEQQANFTNATIVAEELVRRVTEAPPHQKLPPFYLLDSISKNFPTPYATLFPRYLPSLFSSTYASVDGSTKAKMEEMLRTWRTGGVRGAPVFTMEIQEEIEMRIWGRDYVVQMHQQAMYPPSRPAYQAPVPSPYNAPPSNAYQTHLAPPTPNPPLTRSTLLANLQQVLARRYRAAALSPSDNNIRSHIDVLKQLQQLVETSNVSETDLRAIEEQLKQIDASTSSAPIASSPPQPQPLTPVHISMGMPPPTLAAPLQYPPSSSTYDQPLPPPPPTLPVFSPPAHSALPPPTLARESTPSFLGADLMSLMASVLKPREDSKSPQIAKQEVAASQEIVKEDEKIEEPDEYERLILGLNVTLDNLDLKAELPRISNILATQLPSQCRQCGLRAPDTPAGKARLDLHLDWHFRQNKRTRESEGRGNSRAWFVSAEDWVNDHTPSPDSIPPTGAHPTDTAESTRKGGLTAAARQALLGKFVVQPSDPEKASKPCPICKEAFKGEFSEEEEEWLWFNAVEEDGVIFHATCRHDSVNSNTLTTRLLNNIQGGSTPQRASSLTPPPMSPSSLGLVAKAEPVDASDPSQAASPTEEDAEPSSVEQAGVVVKAEPETERALPPQEALVVPVDETGSEEHASGSPVNGHVSNSTLPSSAVENGDGLQSESMGSPAEGKNGVLGKRKSLELEPKGVESGSEPGVEAGEEGRKKAKLGEGGQEI